jgi:hypothetical protein
VTGQRLKTSTSKYNSEAILLDLQLRVGSKTYSKILNEVLLIINNTNIGIKKNVYIISGNFK